MSCINNISNNIFKKGQNGKKENNKEGNSTCTLSHLKCKTNVELVRTYVLNSNIEYDLSKTTLPDSRKCYINDLGNEMKLNDLIHPTVLAISVKAETRYVYETNHRIAPWLDKNVDGVPLMLNHFFLNDDDDTSVSALYHKQ